MAAIVGNNGEVAQWTLLRPSPRHSGWIGFDFCLQSPNGEVKLILTYDSHECYLAAGSAGDDLDELNRQVSEETIEWHNTDERDLRIRGHRNDGVFTWH